MEGKQLGAPTETDWRSCIEEAQLKPASSQTRTSLLRHR